MSQKPRVVAVSVAVATILAVAWLFWGMSSSQEGRHLGGSAGAQIPDSSPAAQSTDGASVSERGVPRVLVRAIDGFGNLITEGVSFQDGTHRDCAFAWRVDEKLYAVNISPGELLTVKHSDFGTRTFRVHADTINVVQFSKGFSVVVNVLEAPHDRVWRLTLRERKERQTVELQIPVASSRDVEWSSTEYVPRAGVYSVMAQSARGWLEQVVEIGSQDETVVYIDMNNANRVAKGDVVLQLRVLTAPQSPLAQEDVPYVVKFSTGSWHTGTGKTSGIGELRIDTLHTPAGSQVMLMHPEYEDRSIEVSAPDFGVVNIGEVVLQPYASIRQFRVVDKHDTPIAGVGFDVGHRSFVSDEAGAVRLGVEPDWTKVILEIRTVDGDLRLREGEFRVEGGSEEKTIRVLRTMPSVIVEVFDQDWQRERSKVSVFVWRDSHWSEVLGADGRARLNGFDLTELEGEFLVAAFPGDRVLGFWGTVDDVLVDVIGDTRGLRVPVWEWDVSTIRFRLDGSHVNRIASEWATVELTGDSLRTRELVKTVLPLWIKGGGVYFVVDFPFVAGGVIKAGTRSAAVELDYLKILESSESQTVALIRH